jgi:microcystin-dependent protein
MSQPYVGEIRLFAGSFNPNGWMFCDGALLPISEYDTLFNLIGTTYGGDGQSTFALPDLRGRIPLHFGNGFTQAETGGVEQVTLTVQQITAHTHPMLASTDPATVPNPQNNVLATTASATPYFNTTPANPLSPQSISSVGGSQPHNNLQPFLCVNFIISLFGIFPSPT